MRRSDPVERFWRRVTVDGECWVYPVKKCRRYGAFRLDGKDIAAHRWSYEQAFGPIPAGLFVCHKCDNPACVRPDHLFIGTHMDNVRDSINKGRFRHAVDSLSDWRGKGRNQGEANGGTRLTNQDVLNIRAEYESQTTSYRRLAAEYGVSPHAIAAIVRRQTWFHI